LAKFIKRVAIPPLFISSPASMKKGMAISAKLSNPVAIRCARVVKEGMGAIPNNIVNPADIPILNAMGTPIETRNKKLSTSIIISRFSIKMFQMKVYRKDL
jgi:hypothetical protein